MKNYSKSREFIMKYLGWKLSLLDSETEANRTICQCSTKMWEQMNEEI